jgi:hypothetical protein
VSISFDLNKLGQEGLEKLSKIEKLFGELGIYFDTGSGLGGRDWEWDWSLTGPITVHLVDESILDRLERVK